jgi:hypothetical protein
MPSGSGGQIAIISVGSLYQSVTSAMISGASWTNFVSESINHTINELAEGSITGYKDNSPSYDGLSFGQGDIQLEPNPNALGHYMRGVFGQASGSLLTHAGSWGVSSGNALNLPPGYGTNARPVMQHTYVPIQAAVNPLNFLPVYALAVYKDVGSAFIFEGGCFSSLEFSVQAGQLAKATVGFMARNVTRASRTTSMAGLVNPGGRPWTWDMTSVQVGSSGGLGATTNYESLTIKLNTPIEGVALLDGTKKYGEYQVNGFRTVAINGTISFRDQSEYDNFIAYQPRYLRLNMSNTNSAQVLGNPSSASFFGIQIDIPNMKYLTWSTPIGGPNRLQTSFTAKAEFDVASLYMISAMLTNTTSAYV